MGRQQIKKRFTYFKYRPLHDHTHTPKKPPRIISLEKQLLYATQWSNGNLCHWGRADNIPVLPLIHYYQSRQGTCPAMGTMSSCCYSVALVVAATLEDGSKSTVFLTISVANTQRADCQRSLIFFCRCGLIHYRGANTRGSLEILVKVLSTQL